MNNDQVRFALGLRCVEDSVYGVNSYVVLSCNLQITCQHSSPWKVKESSNSSSNSGNSNSSSGSSGSSSSSSLCMEVQNYHVFMQLHYIYSRHIYFLEKF